MIGGTESVGVQAEVCVEGCISLEEGSGGVSEGYMPVWGVDGDGEQDRVGGGLPNIQIHDYARGPRSAGIATRYGDGWEYGGDGYRTGRRSGADYTGGSLGCGIGVYDPGNTTLAAVGNLGSWPCGTRLLVCMVSGESCVIVVVRDSCPGCGSGHIDITEAAMAALCYGKYEVPQWDERVWPLESTAYHQDIPRTCDRVDVVIEEVT